MGVRKTESRIPANFTADDLGEAVVSADGRCALVSFITSPLVIDRDNQYVVLVTEAGLTSAVQSFEWGFVENGGMPQIQTTAIAEATYRPQAVGTLTVTVRLLGTGNAEQSSLTLNQTVIFLNAELETLITEARNQSGAGASNPDVLRELINDLSPYYQAANLQAPESSEGFQRFVFSLVHDGALQRPRAQRQQQLSQLAAALNGTGGDFVSLAAAGVGVCGLRLALVAMTLPQTGGSSPPILPWAELPDVPNQRSLADEQLRQTLANNLDENQQIDLFNLVRFPKSNITLCGRILETLRDRYFSGTNFDDVLTGLSGTRAHWIMRHYREGPLVRS
jgi:hypothetical protein